MSDNIKLTTPQNPSDRWRELFDEPPTTENNSHARGGGDDTKGISCMQFPQVSSVEDTGKNDDISAEDTGENDDISAEDTGENDDISAEDTVVNDKNIGLRQHPFVVDSQAYVREAPPYLADEDGAVCTVSATRDSGVSHFDFTNYPTVCAHIRGCNAVFYCTLPKGSANFFLDRSALWLTVGEASRKVALPAVIVDIMGLWNHPVHVKLVGKAQVTLNFAGNSPTLYLDQSNNKSELTLNFAEYGSVYLPGYSPVDSEAERRSAHTGKVTIQGSIRDVRVFSDAVEPVIITSTCKKIFHRTNAPHLSINRDTLKST